MDVMGDFSKLLQAWSKKLNFVREVVINSVIRCGVRNCFLLKTGIVELKFFVTNRADLVTGQFFSKKLKNQDYLLSTNVKDSTSSEEDPVFFLHVFIQNTSERLDSNNLKEQLTHSE